MCTTWGFGRCCCTDKRTCMKWCLRCHVEPSGEHQNKIIMQFDRRFSLLHRTKWYNHSSKILWEAASSSTWSTTKSSCYAPINRKPHPTPTPGRPWGFERFALPGGGEFDHKVGNGGEAHWPTAVCTVISACTGWGRLTISSVPGWGFMIHLTPPWSNHHHLPGEGGGPWGMQLIGALVSRCGKPQYSALPHPRHT